MRHIGLLSGCATADQVRQTHAACTLYASRCQKKGVTERGCSQLATCQGSGWRNCSKAAVHAACNMQVEELGELLPWRMVDHTPLWSKLNISTALLGSGRAPLPGVQFLQDCVHQERLMQDCMCNSCCIFAKMKASAQTHWPCVWWVEATGKVT